MERRRRARWGGQVALRPWSDWPGRSSTTTVWSHCC